MAPWATPCEYLNTVRSLTSSALAISGAVSPWLQSSRAREDLAFVLTLRS